MEAEEQTGCRQQRAQPCAPRCSEEHNPGGQPHADAEEDRNAPITPPAPT